MMKKIGYWSVVIMAAALLFLLAACGGAEPEVAEQEEPEVEVTEPEPEEPATEESEPEETEAEEEPMAASCTATVGVLLPYTGIAAAVAPAIESGVQYAFDTAEGCEFELIYEDETDDPTNAVNKARKFVEEDGVDVVLGPQLAHTAAAVSAYLAQQGVPHISLSAGEGANSEHTFFLGSGVGDAIPSGEFAYEELGQSAAVLYQDYLYGQQSRQGFVEGFTGMGGEIVSEQPIPFGVTDMAPFLENIGDAEVVAVMLVNPSDFAFVRQYREFGLEQPVIFISNAPQEAPLLAEMGDDVVGMYGASWYTPLIDSPENESFVAGYSEQFGFPPGIATHVAYTAAQLYLEALAETGGDTDPAAIDAALGAIENVSNPAGDIAMGDGRVAIHDQFIQQVAKMDDVYVWTVVERVEDVEPR